MSVVSKQKVRKSPGSDREQYDNSDQHPET